MKTWFDILKDDTYSKDYIKLKSNIQTLVKPNTPISSLTENLEIMGSFPLLIHTGDKEVSIIHHLTPGKINPPTQAKINMTGVLGLHEGGSAIEIKEDTLTQAKDGKNFSLNKLYDVENVQEVSTKVNKLTTAITIRSFTYCPPSFIQVLQENEDVVSALDWIFLWISSLKSEEKEPETWKAYIKDHDFILQWLLNTADGATPDFGLKPRVNSKTVQKFESLKNSLLHTGLNTAKNTSPTSNTPDINTTIITKEKSIINTKEKTKWDKLSSFIKKIF